ncbi:MAG: hypothetical protein RIR57_46 [Bacteroidota bacterium]
MRIYLFFLGFLLLSCAKSIVPAKVISKSTYVDKFPAIKPSLTTVDFALSYDSLFALSQLKTGSVLFQNMEPSAVLDFPLDIRLLGPIKAQSLAKDQVKIMLPVRMQAKPELAGISAGTVSGDLAMNVQLKWDLAGLNTLQIREVNYDYSWLQKPSVKVLGFPVNVSGVVDQLFNQKKPLVLSQLQQSLNASIKTTVTKPLLFQRFFSDIPSGYRLEPVPNSAFDVRNLEFTSGGVKGQVRYFGGLRIKSGVQVQTPILIPIKDLSSSVSTSVLPFQYQLSGPEIVAFLKQGNPKLKGEANLILGSSGMIFKLEKFRGKSSHIEADFDFVLYLDHSLGIQINDSRLRGLGFPASLFTRKIQRKLQAQAANFRFQPSSLLKRLPSSISLQKGGALRFQKIYFDSSSVLIEGALEGNWSLAK